MDGWRLLDMVIVFLLAAALGAVIERLSSDDDLRCVILGFSMIVLPVALAFLVYILLWRTTLGYRIRAVGQNPHASRYAGIKVPRYIVLALLFSGAFAGLAGAIQVSKRRWIRIRNGTDTSSAATAAMPTDR